MSVILFWIGIGLLFLLFISTAFFILFSKELKGMEPPLYFYIIPTMFIFAAIAAKYLGM